MEPRLKTRAFVLTGICRIRPGCLCSVRWPKKHRSRVSVCECLSVFEKLAELAERTCSRQLNSASSMYWT